MNKFLAVLGGKGGVGKTTLSINLAFCLKDHTNVLLVDGNLETPHLGLHLGKHEPEHTFHAATLNKHPISKAIYELYGIRTVLGSLSLQHNPERLRDNLRGLYRYGKKIIVDCPTHQYTPIMQHCDECILVTTPDPVSLAEAYKARHQAQRLGVDVLGTVVNRVQGKRHETSINKITDFLHTPVLEVIPEDTFVKKALTKQQPVVHYKPNSRSGKAFRHIAGCFI